MLYNNATGEKQTYIIYPASSPLKTIFTVTMLTIYNAPLNVDFNMFVILMFETYVYNFI